MLRKASILFISTAISISSYSQYHLLESQFCKETDNRGFDGDYSNCVVRIYKDSTIEIEKYFRKGGFAPEAAFIKTTYTGSFFKNNDTCTVVYLRRRTEKIEKLSTSLSGKTKTSSKVYEDLPFIFFILNGVIYFPGFQFPDMPVCGYNYK